MGCTLREDQRVPWILAGGAKWTATKVGGQKARSALGVQNLRRAVFPKQQEDVGAKIELGAGTLLLQIKYSFGGLVTL